MTAFTTEGTEHTEKKYNSMIKINTLIRTWQNDDSFEILETGKY
jgi:hypothetical protein